MTARLLLTATLVHLALAAPAAADLDPQKVAEIRADQKAALKEIDKKYGDKKPSELSKKEARERALEQEKARSEVLEKHQVDEKELSRYTARMSRKEQAAAESAEKDLEKKAEAKKAAKKGPEEIKIQRGFSDEQPVELEAAEGAPPVVEHGIPAE